MNRLELRVNRPAPLNNELKGINRFVYRKLRKQIAWEIKAELLASGWHSSMGPMAAARVRIERYTHGSKRVDKDNLYGGVKPILDALQPYHEKIRPQGLGVIGDDRPPHLVELVVEARQCPAGKGYTIIIIERVDSEVAA